MYSLGIDIGNVSVKVVLLSETQTILYRRYELHGGKALVAAAGILKEMTEIYPEEHLYGALTGVYGKVLGDEFGQVSDIPALELGLKVLCPQAKSAMEMGSQNARYLTRLSGHTLPLYGVNESCAGGTGSFFEDQMRRLGLELEDYSPIIEKAQRVPRLSGRCSVFAKTDMIHRQQEGVPVADILLGLCYAAVKNFKATIVKGMPIEKPLALCGGILKNKGVIQGVKDVFGLSDEELIADEDLIFVQAVGAARYALANQLLVPASQLIHAFHRTAAQVKLGTSLPRLSPLALREGTRTEDPQCREIAEGTHCLLGIDVGSTSTNLVVTDGEGRLLDFQYLRTQGDPQRVVREGLASLGGRLGSRLIIDAVGVTGSGRHLIGEMIGADTIKDEITAQAKAALKVNPHADTVFEIGGQDSKYISLEKGEVSDFQMNKICAAGTGSFIEEQALRLGIPIEEYGGIALKAQSPLDLGERCTVFIESNIGAALANGEEKPDILAGLCHSVIRNYLHKVVGNKPVGQEIVLQGGVCYNPAVVAAFQGIFGDRVQVSPCFSVSGAYGVALLAGESIGLSPSPSRFKGFDLSPQNKVKSAQDKAERLEISLSSHHNDFSHNSYFSHHNYFAEAKKMLLGDYTGRIDPKKKTIGVPYVLVVHKFFPMIKGFFESLGFNVLLSAESNEKTIALAQNYAQAETCYPVKLIYGHMAELAEKGVDYIFLPSILTMKHETSKVHHNYSCVYMQKAPEFVFKTLKLAEKGIQLLNPVFNLDYGKPAMAGAMIEIGTSLGKMKPFCVKALAEGAMGVRRYTAQVEKAGRELLDSLPDQEKVIVIVTRNYGISDPVLNMGIPQEFIKRGYKVITLGHLPGHDLDLSHEYENLYWPFGQHIIGGAKIIKNHPNLYAVYLNNHGCGPDTMISHLFRQEMGDKPYLNIEVDEHYSKVGVITRIEAFINTLEHRPAPGEVKRDFLKDLPRREVSLRKTPEQGVPVYFPHLYPYADLLGDTLKKHGYEGHELPPTTVSSLNLGKSKTLAKEYLSFTALLGDVLHKAQDQEKMQVILPATEGGEIDGLYSRVIYDILARENMDHVTIISPILETLPCQSSLCPQLFISILAGDLILAAPPATREDLRQRLKGLASLSMEDLLEAAHEVARDLRDLQELQDVQDIQALWDVRALKPEAGKIAVLGEPYVLYNAYLNGELFKEVEKKGKKIATMPLSEYLCFLWYTRCENKKERGVVAGYISQMERLSAALGENTPFAPSFADLLASADDLIPDFAGANGRYRRGKTMDWQRQGIPCIEVASLYENAQTVLHLLAGEEDGLVLRLGFDESGVATMKDRLHSFLYYMERKKD